MHQFNCGASWTFISVHEFARQTICPFMFAFHSIGWFVRNDVNPQPQAGTPIFHHCEDAELLNIIFNCGLFKCGWILIIGDIYSQYIGVHRIGDFDWGLELCCLRMAGEHEKDRQFSCGLGERRKMLSACRADELCHDRCNSGHSNLEMPHMGQCRHHHYLPLHWRRGWVHTCPMFLWPPRQTSVLHR